MGTEIHSKGKIYNPDTITAAQLAKLKTTDNALWQQIIDIKNGTTV